MIIRIKRNPNTSILWTTLLLVFMCHGILYFLPGATNSYYSYESPIKIIKYLIVFIGMMIGLLSTYKLNVFALMPIGISLALVVCSHIAHRKFTDYIVLANYCVPILTVFLYPQISKKVNIYKANTFIYIFSSIVGYIEFLFLKGRFGIFADVGYRACSIFINPNNFAAYIFLSTTIILMNETSIKRKTIILANSYILLGMSGSRSGLVMMTISILLLGGYSLIKQLMANGMRITIKMKIILIGVLAVGVIVILLAWPELLVDKITTLLDGGRKISDINLKVGRFDQVEAFFARNDFNFFFPNINSEVYTDNSFLHIWGFFGIGILLLYLGFTIYIIVKLWKRNKKRSYLLILLFLFGVFENYLYLWPVSYVYWFLVSSAYFKDEKKRGILDFRFDNKNTSVCIIES